MIAELFSLVLCWASPQHPGLEWSQISYAYSTAYTTAAGEGWGQRPLIYITTGAAGQLRTGQVLLWLGVGPAHHNAETSTWLQAAQSTDFHMVFGGNVVLEYQYGPSCRRSTDPDMVLDGSLGSYITGHSEQFGPQQQPCPMDINLIACGSPNLRCPSCPQWLHRSQTPTQTLAVVGSPTHT